ncbi:SDR family NAD(P)-dependent oxidoreductase [Nocardioides sp. LS1]|uniref:SDR family NAD(P)-dependent oxidoreductase n=1 Tax=Nocardioides sp. LS1 TaxID=1027620 RepID=UPI000F61C01F|nr:SDR family oxidoreductase [Nocardioides sp. LS1]GCD88088.1 short-chain dehydrogenase [Nocardioides sp. LS1]
MVSPRTDRQALLDLTARPVEDLISLVGQVAVVTGGAAGIGSAICRRLQEAGASVVVADHDVPSAERAADKLGTTGVAAHVDVRDGASIADLAKSTFDSFGRLDIWVNNAGAYPRQALLDITDDDWDAVHTLNLRSAFIGSREAARQMIVGERGGVIVNMTSTAAYNTASGGNSAHYVSSKHALAGLTKSLAVELGEHGIRTVAVAPTLTWTPGVEADYARGLGAGLDHYASRLPAGRLAQPDDIARVVLFATSGLAGFVSGSTIDVDGGDLAL